MVEVVIWIHHYQSLNESQRDDQRQVEAPWSSIILENHGLNNFRVQLEALREPNIMND